MEGNAAERPPYLWACATFLIVLGLYVVTLSPTIAFWDTAEYVAAAKTLGIPHPPGNPLFTLMAHAWGLLPLAEEYAKRINYFAAFTSAAGAGFWFLIAERWLRGILAARTPRLLAAFAGIFASACAWTVWNQSTVNEKVYTVSLLTIAIVVWCAVYWADQPEGERRDRWIVLAVYLSVLSSTNHQMGILGLPVVGWYVFSEYYRVLLQWRVWLLIAATGVLVTQDWVALINDPGDTKLLAKLFISLGLIVYATMTDTFLRQKRHLILATGGVALLALTLHYLYLPIRAAQYPPINEGEPVGFFSQALMDNLNRVQYAKPGLLPRQPWYEGMPINNGGNFVAQLVNYWQYWTWQWGRDLGALQGIAVGIFTALGLGGVIAIFRSKQREGVAAFALLFTLTIALIYFLNFKFGFSYHANDPNIGQELREVRERDYFFVGSFAFVGVLFAAGFASIIRAIGEWADTKVPDEKRWMAGTPVLVLALIPLVGNRVTAPRWGESLARDFAIDILESIEPYGILITAGDNDTFPLWYAQEVLGIRPDVTLANLSLMNTDWHLRQIRRRVTPDFNPETANPYWRPGTDSANQRLGVPPEMKMWEHPKNPVLDVSEETLDGIPEYSRTPQDPTVSFGNMHIVFGRPALEKADYAAVLLIRDNLGKRPIYFSWSDADYPDEHLGLRPYLVSHGLVRKLMPDSVKVGGDIAVAQYLSFVDMRRTRDLLFGVYHPESAGRDRGKNGWIDTPSGTILQLYGLTYLTAAQLFRDHNETKLADSAETVGRNVTKSLQPMLQGN